MKSYCNDIFQIINQDQMPSSTISLSLGIAVGSFAAILMVLAVQGHLFRLISWIRQSPATEAVEFSPIHSDGLE
jgi:hypothetical protein